MAKTPKPESISLEKCLIWSGIIIAVALILRLVHLFHVADSIAFGYLSYDRLYYQQIAQQFVAGIPFEHEILFKPQLYPYLLGLIFKYLGGDLFLPLLIQGIMSAVSCALIFLIALRFYPLKVAVTAGLIAAVYGTFVYYAAELLPITLIIMLNLLVIYLLLRYDDTRNSWYPFLAGLALGLSASAGPSALIFFAAIIIWIFRRYSKRRVFRTREAGLLAVGLLIAIVPFWLRGLSAGDEEIPFATHAGVVLAMGNNPEARGNTMDLPGTIAKEGFDFNQLIERSNRVNIGERPLDKIGSLWFGQAVDYVVDNPDDWLLLELRKVGYMFMGYENWRYKPLYYFASESAPLKFLLWDKLISIPFGLILPLAMVALFGIRSTSRRQGLLIAYLLAGVIVMLLSYVAEGQRLIYVPVIVIWAAAGLWSLVDRYRAKDYKRFYPLLAVFIVTMVISNGLAALPGLSPRVNDQAVGEVYVADALIIREQYTDARVRLERAMRLEPRLASAYLTMGKLNNQQQRYEEALQNYRRASGLDPENPVPKQAIAGLLQQLTRIDELNHFIVRIIRENPKANWAHEFYASMHMRLEEYMQAADIMERAYQEDSTYFDAIFVKANAYLEADMRVEAERELKRYLEFMPNSVEAHANLGQVYARQQRFDLALRQFEAARSAQPWNPASYFNLATLRFQMGDLREAHAYLDTVLMLDPDFPRVEFMRARIDSARANEQ